VSLEIGDDGVGFEPAAIELDPRRGIGLRNMRERIAAIGGRLAVRSESGGGTSIRAEVRVPTRTPWPVPAGAMA